MLDSVLLWQGWLFQHALPPSALPAVHKVFKSSPAPVSRGESGTAHTANATGLAALVLGPFRFNTGALIITYTILGVPIV